jgi:acylglycerol lipase
MWTPPESEKHYYSIPSPSSKQSILNQLLPLRPEDPTYGRTALPRAPEEQELRLKHKHRDGKVFLNGSDNEWVAYQVWEPKQGVKDRSKLNER